MDEVIRIGKAELANALLYTPNDLNTKNVKALERFLDDHMRESNIVEIRLVKEDK